jgi:hypothetical protein
VDFRHTTGGLVVYRPMGSVAVRKVVGSTILYVQRKWTYLYTNLKEAIQEWLKSDRKHFIFHGVVTRVDHLICHVIGREVTY